MEYRLLGNSDLKVSRICLGTMTYGEQNTEVEAHQQLDYAIENGVNFIDTAEMYPVPAKAETQGRTEEYIGSWIQSRRNRSNFVLASKITGPNRAFEAYIRNPLNYDPQQIRLALEGSLRRLKTDYLDLYQLHWPERLVNVFGKRGISDLKNETWEDNFSAVLETLTELKKEGKIKYYGVSNETPWGTMQQLTEAKSNGFDPMISIQNPYSLVNRTYEYGMSEISLRENIPLLAYSPMAFGLLSGKYFNENDVSQSRLTLFPNFKRYNSTPCEKATRLYCELAKDYQLTPAQLSLAFVNAQSFVGANIIGATTLEQLKENIASINVELEDSLLEEINKIHELYPNPAP